MRTSKSKSSFFVVRSAEGGRSERRVIDQAAYETQRDHLAVNGIPRIKPVIPPSI